MNWGNKNMSVKKMPVLQNVCKDRQLLEHSVDVFNSLNADNVDDIHAPGCLSAPL